MSTMVHHEPYRGKVVNLYQIEGLNRVACDEAKVGDIVTLSGTREHHHR